MFKYYAVHIVEDCSFNDLPGSVNGKQLIGVLQSPVNGMTLLAGLLIHPLSVNGMTQAVFITDKRGQNLLLS